MKISNVLCRYFRKHSIYSLLLWKMYSTIRTHSSTTT